MRTSREISETFSPFPHRQRLGAAVTLLLVMVIGLFVGAAHAQTGPDVVLLEASRRPVVLWVSGVATATPLIEPPVSPAPGPAGVATPRLDPSPPGDSPIMIGSPLGEDLVVRLDAESTLVLLDDGQRLISLTGPTSVAFSAGALRRSEGPALRLEPLAGFREVRQPPAVIDVGGQPPEIDALLTIDSPRRTAIRDRQPRLRWASTAPDGARFDVRVECQEEDRAWHEAELWRGVSTRALSLWRPLTAGARCRVKVGLSGASDAAASLRAEAGFRVLDVVEARTVDGGLAALDDLPGKVSVPGPAIAVLRARFLERHGLLEDAEAVWAGLAADHPERAELAEHRERMRQR